MADLNVSATVSRAELSLGNLVINSNNGYNITREGIGPGSVDFRKMIATSPYVKGHVLVHAVPEMRIVPLTIRVKGANKNNLFEKIDVLIDAFSQITYNMIFTVDTHTEIWKCEMADSIEVGKNGAIDDLLLRSNMQYVNLSIPRRP